MQSKINELLTAGGFSSLDFLPGSVGDTLTLIISYMIHYVEAAVYYYKNQAYIHTADLTYLKRKALDYDVTVSDGAKATGTVTFTRLVATTVKSIASGTQVVTSPEFYSGLVFLTTDTAVMGEGEYTVSVDVEAAAVGTQYNVEANTIRNFVVPVSGVEYVSNASATSGGTDGDNAEYLRSKLKKHVQNLSRGTTTAIEYRAESISGVVSSYVDENPDGELFYNDDSENTGYEGTWSNITNVGYTFGTGRTTSTASDYVVVTFQGESSFTPVFIGSSTASIVEVFLDTVSQGQYNVTSDLLSFDGLEYQCTTAYHTVKIVLVSGTLNWDGMKVYSETKRDATINVYIDDGSGSASWTLLKTVQSELENWRACGIKYFVSRCEVDLIDLTISLKWDTSANKSLVKLQIEADISEYLTTIKSGGTIYINNLYSMINYQAISGKKQVITSIITSPTADITMDRNTVPRLGVVTFNEL